MQLDVILPVALLLTPDMKVIPLTHGDQIYQEDKVPDDTILLNLTIMFDTSLSEDNKLDTLIWIDYAAGDNIFIDQLFEYDNACTTETFTQKQYEIASKLGINTIDI